VERRGRGKEESGEEGKRWREGREGGVRLLP